MERVGEVRGVRGRGRTANKKVWQDNGTLNGVVWSGVGGSEDETSPRKGGGVLETWPDTEMLGVWKQKHF